MVKMLILLNSNLLKIKTLEFIFIFFEILFQKGLHNNKNRPNFASRKTNNASENETKIDNR